MSYNNCGSAPLNQIIQDVNQSKQDIITLNEEQDAQDVIIQENKNRSETNEENISILAGSIEVKAFLETESSAPIPLVGGVTTVLEFVKSLATNPDILDYDEVLNIFKFPSGITGLYTDIEFGQAVSGLDTNGRIELYDLDSASVVAERNFTIPQGSNRFPVNLQRLFNNQNPTHQYRVRLFVSQNITATIVYNNFEYSLTNSLKDSNVELNDPTYYGLVAGNKQEDLNKKLWDRKKDAVLIFNSNTLVNDTFYAWATADINAYDYIYLYNSRGLALTDAKSDIMIPVVILTDNATSSTTGSGSSLKVGTNNDNVLMKIAKDGFHITNVTGTTLNVTAYAIRNKRT